MNFAAVLGACAMIFSAGFGTVRLMAVHSKQTNFKADIAFSWIVGTGIVSLLIWIFGFWLKGALLPTSVAFCCLLLPFLARKISTRPTLSLPSFSDLNKIDVLLALVLLFEIATMFYLSYVHTLGTDGILNWEIKARYAYENGGVLPQSYLQDSGRAFSHPEYPLGLPYTEMWLYFWLGESNQFWAKTIFGMFYAIGASLLAIIGANLTGRNSAGLIAASLLLFVPQVSVDGGGALVGYADFPLSIFYLASIGALLLACRTENDWWFRIYAASTALLPWIKREGAILWVVAVLCGVLVIVHQRKSWPHFLALVPGAMIIIAWRVYLAYMGSVSSPDFLPVNLSSLTANLHRLGPIAFRFASQLVNTQVWSLFWVVVTIAILFLVWRQRNIMTALLLIAVVAPIAIYVPGYIFSAWPDYISHIELSIGRLLMHVAPLALLMIAAAAFDCGRQHVPATPRTVRV
jgi:hypothetical protein